MRRTTADRRARVVFGLAIAALAVDGCGATGSDKAGGEHKAAPTVLTMANGQGDNTEINPFAAAVARLSGGTLRIEFEKGFNRGRPDFERSIITGVKAGTTELGWVGSRALDDVGVTSFDALHAPLLIDSYSLERSALASPLAKEMLAGLEPVGVVGLGILPGPLRKPLGVAPLVRPDDYDGKTIAFQRSQVTEQTLSALGARGAQIPSGGSIDAYDGVEQQVGSIAGNQYDEVGRYLTANVNLWPRPMVLFANPKAFAALTAAQQGALRGAARAAMAGTLARQFADAREGLANLCRRGVTLVTADAADLAALRRAVQPVYDRIERNAQTKAAIARIRALRAEGAAPADAPACPDAVAQSARSAPATPIDGVYRFRTTAKDLRALGGSPDVVPENYGAWTWVLDRGHFTYTQRNGVARERASGTYTVTGDRFTFTIEKAAGVYPTGARAKPGERFTFSWSLYRDRLTLRPVQGEISPDNHRAKPWRRVGDAPSAGGAAAPAAPARTPIDGVYRLTTTREESARASGESPQEVFSENYGRWRFVFSRGQLRYTQSSEGASRWTKATYTVTGHTLEYTITDFGGEAPNGAAEKTGEVFTYTWSLYRDRLTLKEVKGKISPGNFRAKPWRRVGDAP